MGKYKFSETKVFLVALLLLHFFPLPSDAARQSSRLVRLFTSGGMNKVLQYVWIRSPVLPSFSSPTKFTILNFLRFSSRAVGGRGGGKGGPRGPPCTTPAVRNGAAKLRRRGARIKCFEHNNNTLECPRPED